MKIYLLLFLILIFFFSIGKGNLELTNSKRYLSPNHDNIKDDISFPIKIQDDQLIQKYIVNILIKKNNKFSIVRTFKSVDDKESLKSKKFKWGDWVGRIFERKKNINIPEKIIWDGMDNNQLPVSDGIYYIQASAFDNSKNKTTTKPIPIVVDTISPKINVTMKDFIFSPNNDQRKDKLSISYQLKKNKFLDKVLIDIKNKNNEIIRTFKNNGKKNNFTFYWDGENSKKKEVKQDFYKIDFTIYDLAGNTNQKEVKKIYLQRDYEKATISSSKKKLSPNKDGLYDDMVIMPRLSSEQRLQSWQVKIQNKNDEEVFLFQGKNKLTKNLLFYGKDKKNKILADGKYSIHFLTKFTSGNIPQSEKIFFLIDNTPPKFNMKLMNSTFNPLAKNGRKKLRIKIVKDNDKVVQYNCFIKNKQGEIVLKKNYTFNTIPDIFTWDGKQQSGDILSGIYTYTLKGLDDVANQKIITSPSFEILMGKLQVDIFSDKIAFSPNGDKIKDIVTFTLNISKQHHKVFQKAVLSIYKQKTESPIWQKEFKSYKEKIIWSGKNKKNKIEKDGKYFYSVLATFKTEENFQTKTKEIFIDTLAPQINLSVSNKIFSPNGDNRKDSLLIEQTKDSNFLVDLDQFKMQIVNAKGVVQRISSWQGNNFPNKYIWQGDNLLNEIVPNGKYAYQVLAQDQAGNRFETEVKDIIIVNDFEEMNLNLSKNIITRNPTLATNYHFIEITPNFSRNQFLEKIVYQLPHQKEWRTTTNLKKIILKQGDLKELKQNEFKITSKAYFSSGNLITTISDNIFIDDTPPEIQVKTYPKYFSPDNDNKNETLQIYVNIKENSTIQKVDGILYRKIEFDSKGKKFKQNLKNYEKNKIDIFKKFNWKKKVKLKIYGMVFLIMDN